MLLWRRTLTKHVHYDTIVAWANGATIEASADRTEWFEAVYPEWRQSQFYRVKPVPKPDIVHEVLAELSHEAGPFIYAVCPEEANVVFVFDGTTRKLKGCSLKEATKPLEAI